MTKRVLKATVSLVARAPREMRKFERGARMQLASPKVEEAEHNRCQRTILTGIDADYIADQRMAWEGGPPLDGD